MIRTISQDRPMLVFLILGLLSLLFPVGMVEEAGFGWTNDMFALSLAIIGLAIAVFYMITRPTGRGGALVVIAGVIIAAAAPLALIEANTVHSFSAYGLWLFVIGLGFYAWRAMEHMSGQVKDSKLLSLVVPALFGMWLLYIWQVVTTGFKVPSVLLPSPDLIGLAFMANLDILAGDFYQTFVKSVLSGFAFGCGSGFLVAILVDKIPFMQRGLLPLGSLVSAIPIVGIAPIMVMWFGFDWQSKAAVIVVMTFFPMLVNTLAGLEATSHLEKDLMRSYAASYFQTLFFVRLPNALPFIFNALKINSTLALIGAIVAEFFGTPIVGMGFRISTEVGRMNVDIVWATIAVAAVAGSLFYGILAIIERSLTFWHPSYRSSRS
ncbi:ABC transporter permease [Sneathiella aquimaris]|uniref:ABC transporter permease n=1 Tax=Sneathiella aquimaris TaxID=2599305 RepID=UPI001C67033F|nr:ABC transporter permease [Sneathiella aquimaris]